METGKPVWRFGLREYSRHCVEVFFENQGQLFDRPVAASMEEAEEFLTDCMAVVAGSLKEVRDYLDDAGMDIEGMSLKELEEIEEVFPLGDGTYLIVEA